MKCPNCGGDVSVNDLRCPYCGTPNPEGIAFQEEVHKRKRFNEYLRKKITEQMQLPLMHRILNLGLIILFLIALLLFLVSLGIFLFQDIGFPTLIRPRDYKEQMAQMYEEGRYNELDHAMESWNLEPSDYPEYTQMTILNYTYREFLTHSMNCVSAIDQGLIPDEYHLEFCIRNAQELLVPDIPAYPDIYPENQEQLSVWQEEALIYLIGILNFTEEEMAVLYPTDQYDIFSYDELDVLTANITRRLKEAGFHEENEIHP